MMLSISSLLTIVALCLLSTHNVNGFAIANSAVRTLRILQFSWSDCGPSSDPVQITALSVNPSPIKLPGNITVSTSFTTSPTTATDLAADVLMEKKVAGFYVKIPCVDNVGSCTYGDLCNQWAQVCPKEFEKYGLPCNCPFPAKTYTVSDVVIPITGQIPGIIDGNYRITANLKSASAGHVGCLQVIVDLSQ